MIRMSTTSIFSPSCMLVVCAQEVQGKREVERNKLLAARAQLRREVAELRAQNQRLAAQLTQERNDRRMAELATRDAAAERNALEAACETAAQEVSRLQDEMARLKAKVSHGAAQAQQRTQVRACTLGNKGQQTLGNV
jgi:chromosome segregation ATPase